MILTCPNCGTRYQADGSKFPPAGRKVKCAKCGESWHQDAPAPEPVVEPVFAPVAEPVVEAEEPAPPPSPPPQPAPTITRAEPVEDEPPRASAFVVREQAYIPPSQPTVVATDAPRNRSAMPARLGAIFGWAILAAIVLAIGYAAVKFRTEVATAWPQTASLYGAAGMPVNPRGIDLKDVSYTPEKQDGQSVLAITGKLVNSSEREQPVPQLRAALSDDEGRELYHWTFNAGITTMKPGQVAKFLTRISSPPPSARHLQVRFAKDGE